MPLYRVGAATYAVQMFWNSATGSANDTAGWASGSGNRVTHGQYGNQAFPFILPVLNPIVVREPLPLGAPPDPLDQEGYRWRNDDGSETTATWKVAQDTNVTLALDANARLRFVIPTHGDVAAKAYTLYYKLSTDSTWLLVPVGGAGAVIITPSSNIAASGEPTTAQLTPPS